MPYPTETQEETKKDRLKQALEQLQVELNLPPHIAIMSKTLLPSLLLKATDDDISRLCARGRAWLDFIEHGQLPFTDEAD